MGIALAPLDDDQGVERYILSERVAVELRTGAGFFQAILDKTLFTSAIYLREAFDVPVLIVEGGFDYTHRSINPQAVRGALTAMMLVYGVSVLASPAAEESAALIAMMARQEQVGVPEISLVPKRKAADLGDLQRRVVEMLPGCGLRTARELLHYFGSVRRLANAGEAELRAVAGIGPARAAEIHRVLNADYEAVDTERQFEDALVAAPELLFRRPVTLLARQQFIFTEGGERQFVDLVYLDEKANTLLLVELKRDALRPEHETQLARYLDHAGDSPALRARLEDGAALRGVLATVTGGDYVPDDARIEARVVDRARVIEVLRRLRDEPEGAR
jgi:ERCC4-type nuclease